MNGTSLRYLVGIAVASAMAFTAGVAWSQSNGADSSRGPEEGVGDAAALAQFKASGKQAALTVVPTRLGGVASAQVGEVVAVMLERAGMTNLETSTAAFDPPDNANLAQTAGAFAEFIRTNPMTTEYALFTDILGTPQTGPTEVRAVVVTKAGAIVWQDRQAKGNPDFDRMGPREPMQCCLLLVERMRPMLGLDDPTRSDAPQGRFAQRLQKNSGVPDKTELAAIEQRGKAFGKSAAHATLVVYPTHAGHAYSPQSAKDIAAALSDKKLTNATPCEIGPRLQIASDMNEQKMLWSMARGFSEYVRQNPPDADYALYADYLMGKDMVGGVHFAICDRRGELVVVDFQNNHWSDFKMIDPRTREDCDKLIVRRVEGYCR